MKLFLRLKNPERILKRVLLSCRDFIPDRIYLKWMYRLEMKKRLNFDNPETFSEKLQWLKLYDRKPEYTDLVDKAKAKQIVGEKIGFEHIIPTIGEWERVEDIDWDRLPNQFVLKTTHGGGGCGVVICNDISKFDKKPAKKKLNASLKSNIYKSCREWPYKNISKKIIAEKYISSSTHSELKDYKFFCFNGEPKFLKVDFGRFSEHHANYYDLEWNLLSYGETGLEPDPHHVEKMPVNFDKMIEIASILSEGLPFVRIDLYNVNGKIYFGEITFYPASGLLPWTDSKTDLEIGKYLQLPKV